MLNVRSDALWSKPQHSKCTLTYRPLSSCHCESPNGFKRSLYTASVRPSNPLSQANTLWPRLFWSGPENHQSVQERPYGKRRWRTAELCNLLKFVKSFLSKFSNAFMVIFKSSSCGMVVLVAGVTGLRQNDDYDVYLWKICIEAKRYSAWGATMLPITGSVRQKSPAHGSNRGSLKRRRLWRPTRYATMLHQMRIVSLPILRPSS